MADIDFRPVQNADDLALLDQALCALSVDLGDAHLAGADVLRVGLFGRVPAAYGLLALRDRALMGAALFSPVFSTARGAAGVYVSDLWVAEAARGGGLGQKILARVATRANLLWGAEWMTLAVYAHSIASRRFYTRLGFEPQGNMTTMRLSQDAVQRLIRNAQ
ncbi:Acetyltransferase (GNAT) family protein [Roseovarius lutimaris]|uniref:Acetyltransferase (GNAT) family protein n=1 Tax=Roseovarius lutimaris TaxID=1005928 RepID=A0A1I5APK8_9RHOB|nr:GNAT family N-acetyltransferase [Roseovarius lutimaris]SFN64302.1 Acetyltransferase (GNAT) family protein [Roseovarius lutimaris]